MNDDNETSFDKIVNWLTQHVSPPFLGSVVVGAILLFVALVAMAVPY